MSCYRCIFSNPCVFAVFSRSVFRRRTRWLIRTWTRAGSGTTPACASAATPRRPAAFTPVTSSPSPTPSSTTALRKTWAPWGRSKVSERRQRMLLLSQLVPVSLLGDRHILQVSGVAYFPSLSWQTHASNRLITVGDSHWQTTNHCHNYSGACLFRVT